MPADDDLAELNQLYRALEQKQKLRGAHEPFPNQRTFLALDCLEALYGGAAGGGKSDALLMAALQYVHVKGYAALLLRRSYADLALPGAIMDRAHDWLSGTDAKWNDGDKCWTFPSGATLTFGYLDNKRDLERYQSAEFQFIGLDELTQFPETWYRYLLSRLRRPKEGPISRVPLRARGATNPGGLGHKWVKKRFVDPKTAAGPFIPSKLADNPHIDQEEYLKALAQLDPTTRAQLRDGLWVQDTSGLVYPHWNATRCLVEAPLRDETWRYILAMDFGFDDDCAFGVLGWAQWSPRVYLLESFKRSGLIPSAAALEAAALIARYNPDRVIGDTGGLGKGYAEEMRQRFSIPVQPARKQDKQGYIRLFNGALANAEMVVVQGQNDAYVTEVEELPWHDDEHAKEAEGFPNHLTDMGLYGWREAKAFAEEQNPAEKPVPDEQERMRALVQERWNQRQQDKEEGIDWLQNRFSR